MDPTISTASTMINEYLSEARNHSISQNEDLKSSLLNGLIEQFGKFENEVWNYNSLRPQEAFKLDVKLPSLVMILFDKLFRLWKDYEVLRKLIKPEQFQRVKEDLNKFFQEEETENLELVCDTCDELFPFQKNLRHSYDLHAQNARHREILENFNYLMCLTKPALKPEPSKNNSPAVLNGSIVLRKNNELKCKLCDEILKDEWTARQHSSSWLHRLHEFPCDLDSKNHIVEIDGVFYCCLCKIKLPGKDHQYPHLLGKTHELIKECYRALKENENIILLDKKNGEFMCALCNVNEVGWASLLQHYKSKKHQSREFMSFKNGHHECTLCQKTLDNSEVADHERCLEHNTLLQTILDTDVSSKTGQHSSFNDAFKNNDIYIEVMLNRDETELYKCLLCNKNGKGLSDLDSHCLTSEHQELKANIEKISAEVEGNVTNVHDDPIIHTVDEEDDTFYCKVCNVLIEGEKSKIDHKVNKKHALLVQLNEVLKSNGKYISDCSDQTDLQEPKFYHCYICNRTMDGDSNIVSHAKSARHKQLLDIVKELSTIR